MGRYALLIGISDYQSDRLHKLALPEADVSGLELVLIDKSIGAFNEVRTLINPCWYEVQPAITKFFKNHRKDDFLVVFFAGHGVKDRNGHLYLAFKDTDPDDLEGTAIPDSFVASQMDRSRTDSQLLILDCCYSGAFGRDARSGLGTPVGIREVYSSVLDDVRSTGRMILTATDAIQFAWEGDEVWGTATIWGTVTNSIFTHALIQGLRGGEADLDGNGAITVDELYEYVSRTVQSINPNQEPQLLTRSGKHWGDLVIALNPKLVSLQTDNKLPQSVHEALKSDHPSMRRSAIDELERILEENPSFINIIRSVSQMIVLHDNDYTMRLKALDLLRKVSVVEFSLSVDTSHKQSDRAYHSSAVIKAPINILDILPEPFEWCAIPPGYVVMGDETMITFQIQPFSMAKFPITYAQFQVFLQAEDGYFNEEWWQGLNVHHTRPGRQRRPEDNLPRENVSWYDAVVFCRWLSTQLNYEVRLPTEWEWEWAAQGDGRRGYPWGHKFDKTKCNTLESGIGKTTPVDAYPGGASQFGVLDMSGNVWERCLNSFNDLRYLNVSGKSLRGLRGGSWRYTEEVARVTHRHKCVPEKRYDDGGLRIITIRH